MKLIDIIAALALAGVSANAQQECKGPANIPTDDPVAAQTAKCLLNIDNRLLVNERCNVLFLPDGREVALDAGKHYARVSSTLDRRGAPTLLASWNRGSGRNDPLTPLGFVTAFERGSLTCWRNRRVQICTSNYMTCECQSDRYYHCLHSDDKNQQAAIGGLLHVPP
jgi:hypothetical protein